MSRISAVTGLALVALLAGCEEEVRLEGERFDVRAPLEASIPVEGQPQPRDTTGQIANRSEPVSLPAATANASWTHRAGNSRHAAPHGTLSAQPVLVWSADIGEASSRRNRIAASPVVADGRIFTLDALAGVTATSTGGQQLWQVSLVPAGDRSKIRAVGLAYGEGLVFVTTAYGEAVALQPATGAVVWRQKLDAPAQAAPTVEGGTVYVVGGDSTAWAIEAATGKTRWQATGAPPRAGMIGAGAPAIAGDMVLLPFPSGELQARMRAGGTRMWASEVAGDRRGRAYGLIGAITGDPVVEGDTVYVGNQSGRTMAVSASSGDTLWSAEDGAYGPVVTGGGAVFLVSDEAKLVRLDASTGTPVWSIDLPYYTEEKVKKRKAITANYGPFLVSGRVGIASSDGALRLFRPVNGALVSTVEIPGGAASAPALAGGALYVVSQDGQLLAFR